MKRLTKRLEDEDGDAVYYLYGFGAFDEIGALAECVDRLAAYEDTGLEPEEILTGKELAEVACAMNLLKEYQAIGPIDHLRQLAQAEKDGRLVVLPCKKDDALWSFYNYPASGICKILVTAVSTLNGITVINTDNYGVIPEKDIGKTVFLTREEAEAALKKREEKDNETD